MGYVVTALGGLAFGMADQYLGSRSALGAWAAVASLVSAPWVLLGFVAGTTQDEHRRALLMGLLVTLAALVGYFVMTCSPIENVPLPRFGSCFVTIARTGQNPLWIAGGALFGPVYAFLGHLWRTRRSWIGAAAVVGALCLEPLARSVATPWMLSSAPEIWWIEIALGLTLAAFFVRRAVAS
ncbi:MAG TPA: DUF6518 family protein [Actinomycetota bacterium]|nr:DUF6518 family protein [Actinomycetota bacterium]